MALPVITHYFYAPYPGGHDWAEANTAQWVPPTGVTTSTPPEGLVFYGLIFGPMTSVTVNPTDGSWTAVSSGSVGGDNFFLFRRETGSSEPTGYRFEFDPTDEYVMIVGFGVAGSASDVAGTPQFDVGDTATSGALTVPEGNVLSVHIWGGAQLDPPYHVDSWQPDPVEFPDDSRFGYGVLFSPYAATIGEIRDVVTAPGKAASLQLYPGLDNFGIQFLFSDIPVGGGWGVGMVRMGAN